MFICIDVILLNPDSNVKFKTKCVEQKKINVRLFPTYFLLQIKFTCPHIYVYVKHNFADCFSHTFSNCFPEPIN